MRRAGKIEAAARAFFEELVPGADWTNTDHPGKGLSLAAFTLYDLDHNWRGRTFDVREWKWPAKTLAEYRDGIGGFSDDRAWTVLLRRAAELAPDPDAPELHHWEDGGVWRAYRGATETAWYLTRASAMAAWRRLRRAAKAAADPAKATGSRP